MKKYTEKNCPYSHLWPRLNKRDEGKIILAFCNHCDFIDGEYTNLQWKVIKRGYTEDIDKLNEYINNSFSRKRRSHPRNIPDPRHA